jgi:hypothetical protein
VTTFISKIGLLAWYNENPTINPQNTHPKSHSALDELSIFKIMNIVYITLQLFGIFLDK